MDHVQILATSGLIGFIAYGWLIFALIQKCYQIEKKCEREEYSIFITSFPFVFLQHS